MWDRLRAKVGSLVTDDPWYDWADQWLDNKTRLPYHEWLKHRENR